MGGESVWQTPLGDAFDLINVLYETVNYRPVALVQLVELSIALKNDRDFKHLLSRLMRELEGRGETESWPEELTVSVKDPNDRAEIVYELLVDIACERLRTQKQTSLNLNLNYIPEEVLLADLESCVNELMPTSDPLAVSYESLSKVCQPRRLVEFNGVNIAKLNAIYTSRANVMGARMGLTAQAFIECNPKYTKELMDIYEKGLNAFNAFCRDPILTKVILQHAIPDEQILKANRLKTFKYTEQNSVADAIGANAKMTAAATQGSASRQRQGWRRDEKTKKRY